MTTPGLESIDTRVALRRRAEELGLPVEAPVDLKIHTPDELGELRSRGLCRVLVRIA